MESHGLPDAVHCIEAAAALLLHGFALKPLGAANIEGKDGTHTFSPMRADGNIGSVNGA
jgi:hypothetical protein